VPPEYSIERLTCAIASRFDAVMVGWPDAVPPEYSISGLVCRYWLRAWCRDGWLAGCP
jgi:hypothetical protein